MQTLSSGIGNVCVVFVYVNINPLYYEAEVCFGVYVLLSLLVAEHGLSREQNL